MSEQEMIGWIVAGLLTLTTLAGQIKSLFGGKDYVTRADMQRLEDKYDRLISEFRNTTSTLNAAIARLEQAFSGCLCAKCVNFSTRKDP